MRSVASIKKFLLLGPLKFFISVILIVSVLQFSAQTCGAQVSPYPQSPVIDSVTWEFGNLVQRAPGSDLWPITWADDGHLYTSWGDGGGFGGTNSDGRVSLGFARIEGPPDNFTDVNVWGGKNPENLATFSGKSPGILSVNGILYAWIWPQDGGEITMKLGWSSNKGQTWQLSGWRFGQADTLRDISFLNYGKDYQGARDGFVYGYALERGGTSDPANFFFTGGIHLLRVPKDHSSMINRASYEFFSGLDGNGNPMWTSDIQQRQPVFSDSNGVGIPSVSYNPGINRYLLTMAHGPNADGVRKLGLFDAPEPWGPWTTVEYNNNWGGYSGFWLLYAIPTKTPDWMSTDGKTFHLVFSGKGSLDSFNLLKATITLKNQQGDTIPPDPPVNLQAN